MTRTTVRPLVGSGVGSRGSLVGSLALVGWVASLVGALVCGLAGGVGGVAGRLAGVLACGFAGGFAGVAGGLAGVFARWLACSLCRRLLWSPSYTWGMTRITVLGFIHAPVLAPGA